jgi:hypothetical protein
MLVKLLNRLIDTIIDRRFGDSPANYVRFHRYCPQCGNEMMPDVILEDGRGLRAANIQVPSIYDAEISAGFREANGDPLTVNVAGEGSYCESCKHGWTIGELYRMGMEKRNKTAQP